MLISYILISLSILLFIPAYKDMKDKNKYIYMLICGIFLVISVIRNPLVGTDSVNNYNAFMNIKDGLRLNYGSGYLLYVKIFQLFSENYRLFLVITSLLILMPVFYILKSLQYRSFAIILYSLSLYTASFDVLKGYLAFSFILLAADNWLVKEKTGKAIGYGIVAFFFHPSILLVALFMLISSWKITQKCRALFFAVGGIFAFPQVRNAAQKVVVFIGKHISSRYASYEGSEYYFSTTYVLIFGFTSLLLLVMYKQLLLNNNVKRIQFLINMHLIGQWLALFGGFIPSVNRYMKFILLFSIILICESIKASSDNGNKVAFQISSWLVYVLFVVLNNGGLIYTIGV